MNEEDTPKENRPKFDPGWHKDIANEDYHKSHGISSTTLKVLLEKTPEHLLHKWRTTSEPTDNMKLGTALHTLVLEPEQFEEEVAVMPEKPKFDARTKAGKEIRAKWEETEAEFEKSAEGKTIITLDQYEKAQAMAKRVFDHPIAGTLVSDIVAESSVYWWYKSLDTEDKLNYKQMLKVRPDAICKAYPVLIDLKTTVDGSYTGFIKSIQRYYYHVSAAMYLDGVNQCKELLEEMKHYAYTKFVFICVENTEPYCVSVYELSKEYVELGDMLYRRALVKLHKAKEEDWPAYPDDIRVIEPPAYARYGWIV